jgi:hypothetical protein
MSQYPVFQIKGIVKSMNGEYWLTSFDKLILNSLSLVEDAIELNSKTKAIDALKLQGRVQGKKFLS